MRRRFLAHLLLSLFPLGSAACNPRGTDGGSHAETAAPAPSSVATPAVPAPAHDEAADESRRVRPKHIFLILIDTLRADHLSAYGYPLPTTPAIDALAARGVLFERAFSSSSNTIESSTALFLSRQPTLGNPDVDALPEDQIPLQVLFKRAGYATFAVVSNPWLTLYDFFKRGFDHWGATSYWTKNATAPVFDGVNKLLDGPFRADQPSFFYIHILDPHDPYAPPKDYGFFEGKPPKNPRGAHTLAGETAVRAHVYKNPEYKGKPTPLEPKSGEVEWLKSRYDAELRHVDEHLGMLVRRLRALGVLDDSLIVITSDHGEEFHEHGGFKHGFHLYDETVHVPLVFHWPRGLTAARRAELTTSVDLAPTLLSMAQVTVPARMAGRRLMDPKLEDRPALLATHYVNQRQRAMRTPRHKVVEDLNDQSLKIFDLVKDPGEQHNLYQGDRAPFEALLDQFDTLLKRYPPAEDEKPLPPVVDEGLRKQLKALGYL